MLSTSLILQLSCLLMFPIHLLPHTTNLFLLPQSNRTTNQTRLT